MRYDNVLIHEGVAHDENPPGPGSGRYPWGSGERQYQHEERIIVSDTIKLDDLKENDTTYRYDKIHKFVNQSDIKSEPIKSEKVKEKAKLGENQTRVKNPSGNGTITMEEKIKMDKTIKKFRYKEGEGKPWRDKYNMSSSKINLQDPRQYKLNDAASQTFRGMNSILRNYRAYQEGKLDDRARARLDKKIRKLSDEELKIISTRIGGEKTLIDNLNARNQQTIKKGQNYTDFVKTSINDQVNTALGVVGIIYAIKKLKGG